MISFLGPYLSRNTPHPAEMNGFSTFAAVNATFNRTSLAGQSSWTVSHRSQPLLRTSPEGHISSYTPSARRSSAIDAHPKIGPALVMAFSHAPLTRQEEHLRCIQHQQRVFPQPLEAPERKLCNNEHAPHCCTLAPPHPHLIAAAGAGK